MIRKLVLVGMCVGLLVALFATIGSRAASGSPQPVFPAVTFPGNVSCDLTGALTISPPATNTSTGPYTVTFLGTNKKCVGLFGTSLTVIIPSTGQMVTLKKSTESFSYTVPASPNAPGDLCRTLMFGGSASPVPPFPIHWFGSGGTISPTIASFPLGGNVLPGLMTWVNGPTAGTFAGTIDVLLGYNIVTVAADCALATGLSNLPVNHLGGDNLMVGPAF